MSVYIHKGTGGEKVVRQVRGTVEREARADTLRHLNPECAVLALTMGNAGMARAGNTVALRARTAQCWHAGCWDGYGAESDRERRIGFAPDVKKVAPEIRAAFRANVSAAKKSAAAAKKSAAKSAAKKSAAPKKSAAKKSASAAPKGGESAVA